MDTLNRLTVIFREIFLDDSIVLTPSTTADAIEAWDSFAQLNIIMAAESAFDITIADNEVPALRNVGDLVALIDRKTSR